MILSDLKLALSQSITGDDADLKQISLCKDMLALLQNLNETSTWQQLTQCSINYLLKQIYGDSEELFREQCARLNALCDLFLKLYGDGSVSLLRAPARINVLGEHIDYVSYIPTASLTFGSREHDMLMLYRAADTQRVRGASCSPNYAPVFFDLMEGPSPPETGDIEADWLSYLYKTGTPEPQWHNYVRGAVNFARVKFGKRISAGFDFAVDSTIPAGGGASSSSALVVLAGAAIREVNNISFKPEELARESAKAEWYIGTRGGSMDHTTICLAQTSSAVLISYGADQTRRVSLPGHPFQWITCFSKPADKGREVMVEYNERAAVSRLLIPAVITRLQTKEPDRYREWYETVEAFSAGSLADLNRLEVMLSSLPDTLSFDTFKNDYPDTFSEFERSFPALLSEPNRWPLQLRTRAVHHLSEVKRVARATGILDSLQRDSTAEEQLSAMREIGLLLNESHQSLRDLYGVSTSEVESLVQIIRSDPNVLGARLMGGGFGGNVLALTTEEYSQELIQLVQSKYYEPQKRDGVREGSVMISTPGTGLANLTWNSIWREAIEQFNSVGHETESYSSYIQALLDASPIEPNAPEVWPVIVAAGKGTRAAASGLQLPKPLAQVGGKPAIGHVLESIRAGLGKTRPPIVIVSRETESRVREVLKGEEIVFVFQPEALGTGDAVINAYEHMRDFQGLTLVVWSTQPVIRAKTVQRTVKLAALFDNYEMVLPTTFRDRPYAPLQRDERGKIRSAMETHLESAAVGEFGETNIGLFLLKNQTMFEALLELRERYWDQSSGRYKRARGELGFPNELINYLGPQETGVFACPIADSREEQGIKQLEDVARCEKYIFELEQAMC